MKFKLSDSLDELQKSMGNLGKEIKEYKVISDESFSEFNRKADVLIKDGWIPIGNLIYTDNLILIKEFIKY